MLRNLRIRGIIKRSCDSISYYIPPGENRGAWCSATVEKKGCRDQCVPRQGLIWAAKCGIGCRLKVLITIGNNRQCMLTVSFDHDSRVSMVVILPGEYLSGHHGDTALACSFGRPIAALYTLRTRCSQYLSLGCGLLNIRMHSCTAASE